MKHTFNPDPQPPQPIKGTITVELSIAEAEVLYILHRLTGGGGPANVPIKVHGGITTCLTHHGVEGYRTEIPNSEVKTVLDALGEGIEKIFLKGGR